MAINTLAYLQRSLLLCLILVPCSELSWGQAKPDFLNLQRALAQLMNAPVAHDKTTNQSVIELRGRVEAFQKALEEASANTPEESAAVKHLTTLLITATKEENLTGSSAIVADINRDLDLKVRYYGSRMGVAGVARGFVTLTVRTVRDGKEVPELVVHCNPYRYADDAKPVYSFTKTSSPTQTSILPGYYRCFASTGQPLKPIAYRDAPVGVDGSDVVTLDILLPK